MEFFNIWLAIIIAIVGYYALEMKKVEVQKDNKGMVDKPAHKMKKYHPKPFLISEEGLHSYIGVEKEDLTALLELNAESGTKLKNEAITINQRTYYKIQSIHSFLRTI